MKASFQLKFNLMLRLAENVSAVYPMLTHSDFPIFPKLDDWFQYAFWFQQLSTIYIWTPYLNWRDNDTVVWD